MARLPPPSLAEVSAHVRYDPETGCVIRRIGVSRNPAGSEAGTVAPNGYRYLSINRRKLAAHRVAILLTHGEWPDGEVDHINGDRLDNRLCNLRVVDRLTNAQNRHAPQRNNLSSGILGVTWHARAGKWQSQIKTPYGMKYLGLFDSTDAASAAYLSAKRAEHAGCTI